MSPRVRRPARPAACSGWCATPSARCWRRRRSSSSPAPAPPLLGRLLLFDALAATWRTLTITAEPGCQSSAERPSRPADDRTSNSGSTPASPRPGVVTPGALGRELAAGRGPVVIDVREPDETDGIVPGSLRIPQGRIASAAQIDALDVAEPVVTVCASGARAAQAAALLAERGFRDVRSLAGAVTAVRP